MQTFSPLQACFFDTSADIHAIEISEQLSFCIFKTEFFKNWTELSEISKSQNWVFQKKKLSCLEIMKIPCFTQENEYSH